MPDNEAGAGRTLWTTTDIDTASDQLAPVVSRFGRLLRVEGVGPIRLLPLPLPDEPDERDDDGNGDEDVAA